MKIYNVGKFKVTVHRPVDEDGTPELELKEFTHDTYQKALECADLWAGENPHAVTILWSHRARACADVGCDDAYCFDYHFDTSQFVPWRIWHAGNKRADSPFRNKVEQHVAARPDPNVGAALMRRFNG